MRTGVDVHNALLALSIPHELYRIDRPVHDLAEVPAAVGLSPDEVARVVILQAGGGHAVAVVPLALECAPDLVAEALGVPTAALATPGVASRATGYPAEWAPPLAHRRRLPVVVDKSLERFDVVYLPAGEPGLLLKIRFDDLVRAAAARTAVAGGAAAPS